MYGRKERTGMPMLAVIKCPNSYADGFTEQIMCRAGKECNGSVYECCQPEQCIYFEERICGYPIEECAVCPNHRDYERRKRQAR